MFFYKFFQFLAIIFVMLLFQGSVYADSSLYIVDDISVNVTSENAVKAQDKAIIEGQVKAFGKLAKRLLSSDEYLSFTMPPYEEIQSMIQGFQISDEKIENTGYQAVFSIKFNQARITNYFNSLGQELLQEASQPTLIVPFLQIAEKILLWEEDNNWFDIWRDKSNISQVVPIVLPLGDLEDRQDVPDMSVLSTKPENIFEMAKRAGAFQAVVAIFAQDAEIETKARVFLFGYNDDPLMQLSETLDIQVDDVGDLYETAMSDVIDLLENRWKEMSALRSNFQNEIPVHIVFNDLGEWVRLKKDLENLADIQNLQINGLKRGRAEGLITFKESIDNLRFALSRIGLVLKSSVGSEHYYITKEGL